MITAKEAKEATEKVLANPVEDLAIAQYIEAINETIAHSAHAGMWSATYNMDDWAPWQRVVDVLQEEPFKFSVQVKPSVIKGYMELYICW